MISTPKTTAKYVLVQYLRDRRRLEPRNVGVFVWTPGATACKFLEEEDADKIVKDVDTYHRWVHFWRDRLSREELALNGGEPVSVRSADYLGEVLKTQKGNYGLLVGGETLDAIDPTDVDDVANQLFADLVSVGRAKDQPKAKRESINLKQACSEVFRDAGVRKGDHRFHANYGVTIYVGKVWTPFTFDWAWGDNYLTSIYQHVLLERQPSTSNAYLMFERLKQNNTAAVKNAKSVAFVSHPESIDDETVAKRLEMVQQVATVINVANRDQAIEDLRPLLAV